MNSKSAVATVVPLAFLSWAVSFSPAGSASPSPSAGAAGADGDGDPVQIDGVVPGCEPPARWGLQALKASAGTANKAATVTVFRAREEQKIRERGATASMP